MSRWHREHPDEYEEHGGSPIERELGVAGPSREEREQMAEAHAEGLHDDVPREFCPECTEQRKR